MQQRNTRFKLSKYSQFATIIGTIIGAIALIVAIIQLNASKGTSNSNLITANTLPSTLNEASSNSNIKDSNIINNNNKANAEKQEPVEFKEYTEQKINKFVSRYNDKIKFGILTVNIAKDWIVVKFYVDNQSNKPVTVATYNNMFLVDAENRQRAVAEPSESDDFWNIQAGVRFEGKVKFNYSFNGETGSLSFKTMYSIMDPSAGDRGISIPINIK